MLAAQIVDSHAMLVGTFVLILLVTATMIAITYWSLGSDAHSPGGVRERDSEEPR